MSKKNISRERRPSLLINTTFLLPALGVDVEEEAINAIKHFST